MICMPYLEIEGLPKKAFYTIDETAEILRVSDDTIRRWIREGRLNSVQVFRYGKHRIPYGELKRFIEENSLILKYKSQLKKEKEKKMQPDDMPEPDTHNDTRGHNQGHNQGDNYG